MSDRRQRDAETKVVVFLPDNLALLYAEATEHMKMNQETLQFFDHYAHFNNNEGKTKYKDMLLLMARAQVEKARVADPAKCCPSILQQKCWRENTFATLPTIRKVTVLLLQQALARLLQVP